MRNPTTFRPTETDSEALDKVAEDFPVYADSTVDLIRVALNTYSKYKNLQFSIDNHEKRIEALEISATPEYTTI